MGFYIECAEPLNKALQLYTQYPEDVKALITPPETFEEIPKDKMLVCVVENGAFDAAGIVYCARELKAFKYYDGRYKTWLLMSKNLVFKLNPHVKLAIAEENQRRNQFGL